MFADFLLAKETRSLTRFRLENLHLNTDLLRGVEPLCGPSGLGERLKGRLSGAIQGVS